MEEKVQGAYVCKGPETGKSLGRPVGREVEPMKRHAVGEQWWRGKSG